MITVRWRSVGLVAVAMALASVGWGQAPLFDVRQYGAKGDGVTDDTAAIQAALDAAKAAGGGTVYVRPGTYMVAATATRISIGSNTTLMGAGNSSIIRVRNNNGDYEDLFRPIGFVEHVTIQDLRIDQNPDGNPGNTIASGAFGRSEAVFGFASYDDVHISRVTFSPSIGVHAIAMSGVTGRASITDCTFDFVRPPSNPLYDSSVIYVESSGLVLRDNTFRSAVLPNSRGGVCAIEVHGGPSVISGNTVDGFRIGMNLTPPDHGDLTRTSYMTVTQNTLTRVLQGMLIWSSTNKSLRGITVSDNLIAVAQVDHALGTWSTGITLNHLSLLAGDNRDIIITSNQIRFQDDPTGMKLDDDSRFAAIGIGPQGSVSNVLVANNVVINAPGRGIIVGNTALATSVYRNIDVLNNTFINPGCNPTLSASARTAIVGRATIIDSHFEGNTITDTAGGLNRACAFSGVFTRVSVKSNRVYSANLALLPDQLGPGVTK